MQENGKIVVGTKIDTKGIDEGLKDIDKKVTAHDVSQLFSKGLNKVKGVIKGLASSIGNIFSKTVSLVGIVAKGVIGAIGGIFTVVKLTLKSITKSMIKIIAASLGLSATLGAVGIVATLIVKSFKKVGEENNELIANIRYLVYVIGQMLTPVANSSANMISQSIKNIINLLAKVITYVAYIINAWFGINILANVSKDAFMAMQKSTDGTADNIGKASKNAKDLKKQLAGFDEMNILQDNNANSGGAGGIGDVGGVGDMTMPTLEIGGEVPEWIKWIADNKDLVIGALAGIVAGLIAMKLELGAIMSLGIGLIIAGIVLLIQDIIKFVKDPTWDNFANILRDISIILAGIAVIMIAIDAANPVGWIILAVATVVALVAVIIKNWDKVKSVLIGVWKWIEENVITPVAKIFSNLWEAIKTTYSPVIAYYTGIFNTLKDILVVWVKTIITIVMTIWENLKIMINNIKQILSVLFSFIKTVIIDPIVNDIKYKVDIIKTIITGLINVMRNIFNGLLPIIKGVINTIWGLLRDLGTSAGNVIGGALKAVVNGILGAVERILNKPIDTINSLISAIRVVPGLGNLSKLQKFYLPRLAKGTILNNPGQGVPVAGGRAIAGEAGREAYLPLSDSQLLEELGSTIGKYITVNLTNVTDIDGRTIARKVTEINNNNDFLLNR